ncbi:MAG: hypothetical protein M2R45_04189 [Verrucomicrobia subdivision 3 bacterium]|nr:hypothetical protein [Limisphaerales bacterium]MCS1413006.1 hypothetical protein [Limisphaerales bacterium]
MDKDKIRHYFIPEQSALTKRLYTALAIVVFANVISMFENAALSGFSLAEACFGLAFDFLMLLNAVVLLPVVVWGSWRQRVPALLGVAFLLYGFWMQALSLLDRAARYGIG